MPIITAYAIANGNCVKVRILADSGSTLLLITRRAAEILELEGPPCALHLQAVGGTQLESQETLVNFELRSLDHKFGTGLLSAITAKKLTSPLRQLTLGDHSSFLARHKFDPREYLWKDGEKIDVILDSDTCLNILRPPAIPFPSPSNLKLLKTQLGPAIVGKVGATYDKSRCHTVSLDKLSKDIEKFMSFESIGLVEKNTTCSQDDLECDRMMKEVTTYDPIKKSYSTRLLWKESPSKLGDNNFQKAKQICVSGKRRSLKMGIEDRVNNAFSEKISAGCSEQIPYSELYSDRPHFWIPAHPILKEDSLTTKTRIVFDASSRTKTGFKGINSLIYPGRNLHNEIAQILLRWRGYRYATLLDIHKCFWNIHLKKGSAMPGIEDTDFCRYMWQWDKAGEPVPYRHTSLCFGVTSSPYQSTWCILNLADRFKDQFPNAASMLQQNLYVDDGHILDDTVENAAQTANETFRLLEQASMRAHKWSTNEPRILELGNIPRDLWTNQTEVKILGTGWNTVSDEIQFNFGNLVTGDNKPQTKRSVLQQTARLYDVTGQLAPYCLYAKLIIREAWDRSLQWDTVLPDDLAAQWKKWCSEVPLLKSIKIKRFIQGDPKSRFLAVFSDASLSACGAAAYLVTNEGSALIFSKTRVSPLKKSRKTDDVKLTVARLETTAALLATRMKDYIIKAFPDGFFPQGIYFFVDSTIVLGRVKSGQPEKYKQWLCNRLKEILNRADRNSFHFVPGNLNPSDICSRSCLVSELLKNELWFNGPRFLMLPQSKWPKQQSLSRAEAEAQNELDFKELLAAEQTAVQQGHTLVLTRAQSRREAAKKLTSSTSQAGAAPPLKKPVKTSAARTEVKKQECANVFLELLKKVSSWTKIIRITSYVVRFVAATVKEHSKIKIFNSFALPSKPPTYLTVPERRVSQLIWIRLSQRINFHDQLDRENAPKDKSKLWQLNAFVDESGLIRANTRLTQSSTLPYVTTHPLILPKHSQIVEKIVLSYHEENLHLPHTSCLYHLSRTFKICGGKSELNRILHKCRKRNCLQPTPIKQILSPLPPSRLDETEVPWKICSTDFFGPCIVTHSCKNPDCPHPREEKAYGALWTDFTTRCVHLEAVQDLTTESFLAALIRFISRRGKPDRIYSDQAKTYKASDKELTRLYKSLDWSKIGEKAAERGITWSYSCSRAPWENGLTERLVKSAKRCLKTTLGNARVSFIGLQTLLAEIEGLLNDRPLITPSLDKYEATITPSILCNGRHLGSLPYDKTKKEDQVTSLSRFHAHRRKIMIHFWNRFRNDYLLQLQASKFATRVKTPILEPGQVVLVRNENMKVGKWQLARIQTVILSRDNMPRRVILKTPTATIERHINKLALLEGTPLKSHQSQENVK